MTNRTQFVKISSHGTKSDVICSRTDAPQGTVLAPFLFTVYTSDCRSSDFSCPLRKFADDTAMIVLIKKNDDGIYKEQLKNFVNYCDRNYLELNVFPKEKK